MLQPISNTHSVFFGYVLWLFGFTGAHRFYFGRQITGAIWFFTLGLLGIGWIIDAFLIPSMDRDADKKYSSGTGRFDYNLAWIFLVFFGFFGIHRFYLGKYITAVIWFFTGGLFLMGYLYDLFTLNEQVYTANQN